MSEPFFSPSWYRVASLCPRLKGDARVLRHRYRGQLWYVLQDPISGRSHRLTPAAYRLIGLMDGERTTRDIWEAAGAQLGDAGPTQDETLRVLGLLHAADLLQCDVPPDTAELLERTQRRGQADGWRRFANPLALRIPLVDPDAFLVRWLAWARPAFTRAGGIVWCVVVGAAALLAIAHASEITRDAAARLLAPTNLLLLFFVYPAVKVLHELGHAFATRVWGGEVHEMGVLMLVLMPVPYVDASSSSAFPERGRRMAVAAAGVGVELFLASLALLVWLQVDDGVVRTVAYNVMWIGGLSTLFFNGNPLLRFDGYYVLSDAIEIPNLAQRSRQYLAYLMMRRGFGMRNTRYPVTASGEPGWFVAYGITSFLYRLGVMFGIAVFLASQVPVLGVALALFALVTQVALPLARATGFLLTSPRLGEERPRALALAGGVAVAVLAMLLVVPVPLWTAAEGVVWPPEGALVRAGADGFVEAVLAPENTPVRRGQSLIRTREPSLEAEVAVLEAKLRELRAKHHAERSSGRVRPGMTRDEIRFAEAQLARARERVGEVLVRSPAPGRFVPATPGDLSGRFVRKGELVGYVIGPAIQTVRVVVPEAHVSLVRERTEGVELMLESDPGRSFQGRIQRALPAGTDRLPSPVLGTAGGGRVPVDPADPDGVRTLSRLFEFEVELPAAAAAREIGARAFVKFHHGAEPLGYRVYRALRRLFLRQAHA